MVPPLLTDFLSLAGVGVVERASVVGGAGMELLSVQQLALSRMDNRHLMTHSLVGA